jgi:hypothetical protein
MDEQRREEQQHERGERGEPAAPGQPRLGRPHPPRPDAGTMPAATPSGPGTAHDRRSFPPRVPRALTISGSIVSRTPADPEPGNRPQAVASGKAARLPACPAARACERPGAHAGLQEACPASRRRRATRADPGARVELRARQRALERDCERTRPGPAGGRRTRDGICTRPARGPARAAMPGHTRVAIPGLAVRPRSLESGRSADARARTRAGAGEAPRSVGFRVTFTGARSSQSPPPCVASR